MRVAAQGKGNFHSLSRQLFWSGNDDFGKRQLPETLRAGDVKSRCSEWLSMPNVGLTAAFAAPRQEGLLCPSGTPLPLGRPSSCSNIMARCSTCVANRGKHPRPTPERSARKGLKLQPNAWLGWTGLLLMGGIRRWQARTWHG